MPLYQNPQYIKFYGILKKDPIFFFQKKYLGPNYFLFKSNQIKENNSKIILQTPL